MVRMEHFCGTDCGDLALALAAATETNRVIGAADVKAGLLLAAQGLIVSAATPALTGPVAPALRSGAATGVVLAAVSVAAVLVVLWPRLTSTTPSWFAFPGFAHPDEPLPARPSTDELADQAWKQVGALATIARRKTWWLRSATAVGGVALLTLGATGALTLLT